VVHLVLLETPLVSDMAKIDIAIRTKPGYKGRNEPGTGRPLDGV
jgi:hypothetical protein